MWYTSITKYELLSYLFLAFKTSNKMASTSTIISVSHEVSLCSLGYSFRISPVGGSYSLASSLQFACVCSERAKSCCSSYDTIAALPTAAIALICIHFFVHVETRKIFMQTKRHGRETAENLSNQTKNINSASYQFYFCAWTSNDTVGRVYHVPTFFLVQAIKKSRSIAMLYIHAVWQKHTSFAHAKYEK